MGSRVRRDGEIFFTRFCNYKMFLFAVFGVCMLGNLIVRVVEEESSYVCVVAELQKKLMKKS